MNLSFATMAATMLWFASAASTATAANLNDSAVVLTVADVQTGVDAWNDMQMGNVQVTSDIVNMINQYTASKFTLYEQLAFVAHAIWESGAFLQTEEQAAVTGSQSARDNYQDCDWNVEGIQPPNNGKFYYGRGYLQLSWCANYRAYGKDRAAEQVVDDEDKFFNEPELVATTYAMDSAEWFFSTNVKESNGKFGSTTNDVNGNVECSNTSQTISNADDSTPCKRYAIFDAMAARKQLTGYTSEGCGSIRCLEPNGQAPTPDTGSDNTEAPNASPTSGDTTTGAPTSEDSDDGSDAAGRFLMTSSMAVATVAISVFVGL